MSEVYLGGDEGGRQVAVKLMNDGAVREPVARARFLREAKMLERATGPGVVPVLDSGIDDDRAYAVGAHVWAPDLVEWVDKSGPVDPRALVRLAVGTAAALSAVHRAMIVYNVFGPGDVLVAPDGPYVTVLGIADRLTWAVGVTAAMARSAVYLTPEQLRGGEDGMPGDVFGWASMIVFAATGRHPFDGGDALTTLHRILLEDPDLSALPWPPAGVVGACLAKDPAQRPSGDAVVRRLLGRP